jgi:hypothetical protein
MDPPRPRDGAFPGNEPEPSSGSPPVAASCQRPPDSRRRARPIAPICAGTHTRASTPSHRYALFVDGRELVP